MIGLAMQKFPELQDGALLLRTMENDRDKGQIEQNGQYPGELTEGAPGILVFQQNAKGDILPEKHPQPHGTKRWSLMRPPTSEIVKPCS